MKKVIAKILSVIMVISILACVPAKVAQAENIGWVTLSTYDELRTYINGNRGEHHVRLGADINTTTKSADDNIVVQDGATFVLDLNGHTLENTAKSIDQSLIFVQTGGSLTIVNSSNNTAKIEFQNAYVDWIEAIEVQKNASLIVGSNSGCGPITIDAYGKSGVRSIRVVGNADIYGMVTLGSTLSGARFVATELSSINLYGPTIYGGIEAAGTGAIHAAKVYGVTETINSASLVLASANMISSDSTIYVNNAVAESSTSASGDFVVTQNKVTEIRHNEHSYGNSVVIKAATTESTGLAERSCVLCGYIDKIVLPVAKAGDSCGYRYDSETKTFYIYGTGAMDDFTQHLRGPWLDSSDYGLAVAEKLVIEEGITRVGDYSFNLTSVSYRQIETIELPSTLTSIGKLAFQQWESLKEINIPEGVETIEQAAFYNCYDVEKIVLPKSVTSIGNRAFSGIKKVKEIYVPSGKLGKLVFGTDEALETVRFGKDVTELDLGLFDECNNVKSVYFEGDAPKMHCQALWSEHPITVYYPEGNTTWTDEVKEGCYGDITWVAYKPGWNKNAAGKWTYFDENGAPVKGWKQISGKWYYFDAEGIMVSGWKQISSKWYYFETSGAMATGWKQLGSKWYYLENSGAMVTGWKQLGGKWYYFETSGIMVSGWKQIANKWYYFNPKGNMASGWQKISNKWYYFETSGVMVTGWKQISGKWYYFETSGVMVTGWKQISGKWYYFKDGVMVTGTQTIGGKTYTFNSNGVWIK